MASCRVDRRGRSAIPTTYSSLSPLLDVRPTYIAIDFDILVDKAVGRKRIWAAVFGRAHHGCRRVMQIRGNRAGRSGSS
eukprot:304062-Chlamydomonas_euryale.AAC.16